VVVVDQVVSPLYPIARNLMINWLKQQRKTQISFRPKTTKQGGIRKFVEEMNLIIKKAANLVIAKWSIVLARSPYMVQSDGDVT